MFRRLQHLNILELFVFIPFLRDELRIVVFGPRQQAPLSPSEKAAQGNFRVSAHLYLIPVRPDVQTDQHHADANGAIELPHSRTLAQT